jgi:hypothetical protein
MFGWVLDAAKHEYYRINIEAANCAFQMVKYIREGFDQKEQGSFSTALYNAFVTKFKLGDIDQELKVSLLQLFGNVLFYIGHTLETKNLENLIELFIDKYGIIHIETRMRT